MNIEATLKQNTIAAVKKLYDAAIELNSVTVNDTRKEFEGDLTIVVFPFVRFARKKPEQVATEIAEYLQQQLDFISHFNVVKGFLNLSLKDTYWLHTFNEIAHNETYGQQEPTNKKVLLEYIGPNTNKPLHLGHIRNMFIGFATANVLSANGHDVHKVTIYNDRGIAVCKSMIAWQKTGKGETPESTGIKGDHFVGKYYVAYDKIYQAQVAELVEKEGMTEKEAKQKAPILLEAREMLLKWEANDPEIRQLWETMNGWVYNGFFDTYKKLGVDYEKPYYESGTYLLGKEMVLKGLKDEVFYQKEDSSIWVDLTEKQLDHKLLLRSDGTSVYITQDLGIAELRYQDYQMDQSIYVVGDEQNYHFKVLQKTLEVMQKPYASGIYHLSYGMVDLPTGKMKSREGTTVDADDLVQEMLETAAKHTAELGKTEGFSEAEANELYQTIGLGALKYFILKVNPQKRMLFNPKESIDFLGHTGPFIQYSHARIQSILRKYTGDYAQNFNFESLQSAEKELIQQLYRYPAAIVEAGRDYDPSVIANYAYQLAKIFNKFYNELPILNNEDEKVSAFRVSLAATTARIIRQAMKILGIDVPDRM